MNKKYEAVIGLEVHAQLLTETKAFCSCSTKFGNPPNTNVCPVCLGHPGVLPVFNKKVAEFTVRMGIATNCTINEHSIFARKNYFYPDLPKGYQISQYEEPICENGFITISTKDGSQKQIRLKRIHMEEDAGKSIHDRNNETLVDVNRCGVPLIEIVTEPDLNSGEEASAYLNKIHQLVRYLEICDGNMEEGSFRCDANISIRPIGSTELGTKTEVKNMNSFKNVEKAINVEIERQINLVEDGEKVVQQTLLWNADLNDVFPMRSKEEAHDYRYFPEPDLFPIVITKEWYEEIIKQIPELPETRKNRFTQEYNLPEYDAEILTQSKYLADYYESLLKFTKDSKSASNWIMGDVLKTLNEKKIEIQDFSISPNRLGSLINLISDGTISGKIAKDIFPIMLEENKEPLEIIKERNLFQITDETKLEKIINDIIANNPSELKQYFEGKEKVFGFFIGQIMKMTQGKANPKSVNEILRKILAQLKEN
ncbi:MAG: Asp-tRNA(Asn)/Glu-tRNA(Gln) amidotransferase subunit GatB [Ignavibacteriaceae bacterium]|nr:Asp-tRNA(Asn)/Glu-tRNA(Gln) amidotransferase subunit GatB [Ignavibacteriaceae bacterium]